MRSDPTLWIVKLLYTMLLAIHVLTGALGLAAMLAPLVTRKGGRVHISVGRIFGVAMGVSVGTGLLIAASWIGIPHLVKQLPVGREEAAVAQLRALGLFFGLLSLFGAHALAAGFAATRDRRGNSPGWTTARRRLLRCLVGLASIVLVMGLIELSPLLVGFGALGLYGGIKDFRTEDRPKPWVVSHLQGMIGCATVASTAFVVQLVSRSDAGSMVQLSAWFVPVALGHVIGMWWTRKVQPRDTASTS